MNLSDDPHVIETDLHGVFAVRKPFDAPHIFFNAPDSSFVPGNDARLQIPDTLPAPVILCGEVSSAMDAAFYLFQNNLFPVWSSILVSSQKSGRGQLGRKWSSPEGNLYAAIRLPFTTTFLSTSAAPATGGLIASAIDALRIPVMMKWPNDIIQQDEKGVWRKVGGILIEERPDPHGGQPCIIAGIGLNLQSSPSDEAMRRDRMMPAGILKPCSATLLELWLHIASFLPAHCAQNDISGKSWRFEAERFLLLRGCPAILDDGRKTYSGVLLGLNEDGGILLSGHEGTSFLCGNLMPQYDSMPFSAGKHSHDEEKGRCSGIQRRKSGSF
ncbi:MAG: hypothetical protein PUB69_04425 [Desulfovibrionaceae bacterium]|nr:hypothetical protein [Desulfovibrionaceae bacterium]